MDASRRSTRLALLIGGLALAVVGAAAMGPPSLVPRFNIPLPQVSRPADRPPAMPTLRPQSFPPFPGAHAVAHFPGQLLGLIALSVVVACALLIGGLWLYGRLRRVAPVETAPDTVAVTAAVQHGIAGAREVLLRSRSERGTAAQAVVDAWATLEDGARVVGLQRRPEQTPSEFTAALMQDASGATAECQELLALYQRARFGGPAVAASLTESDVARADQLFHRISVAIVAPR